jgi:hypothetical protein
MFLSLSIHKTGCFLPFCIVLREERRFLTAWWVLERKNDSIGCVVGIFDEFGSKLFQDGMRACFFLFRFTKTG